MDTAKWSYRTDAPWQAWSEQRAENAAVGSGWHSAFWAAQAGGTGPRTEIDGFEIDSHVPGISHNIIGWDQGVRLSSGFRDDLGFDTSAGWHVDGGQPYTIGIDRTGSGPIASV
ncbi:hypothetical protein GCM10028864_14140 [Microlunatus parietis]